MDERPFSDRAHRPTPEAVARALQGASRAYAELLERAEGFQREWKYSKASGWMLKVHDGQKALFYLVPLVAGFNVSSTVREPERAVLLEDPQLAALRDGLLEAKRYAEGYALRFHVVDRASSLAPIAFVQRLAAIRARPRPTSKGSR